MEDEKVAPLGLPDQLPSAQGLIQANTTPASFQVKIETCFSSFLDHIYPTLYSHHN